MTDINSATFHPLRAIHARMILAESVAVGGLTFPRFRVTVLHEQYRNVMNVTLKLPDDVVREARIRAIHDSKSLSAWVAALVDRELTGSANAREEPMTLAEAMKVPGMPDSFYDKDFLSPDRKETKHREFTFEPDND